MAIAAAVVLAADIASKAWASARLDQPIELLGSLSLQLAHNPGAAFGLGSSLPTWVLLTLTAALCVGIAIGGARGYLAPPFAAGLILGGATGNLLDRLTGGSVVDMIHLTWWPTFNLADVAICTGVAVVIIYSLLPDRPALNSAGSEMKSP
jgi:signal peptidase II